MNVASITYYVEHVQNPSCEVVDAIILIQPQNIVGAYSRAMGEEGYVLHK
jgi:hypothetical protein